MTLIIDFDLLTRLYRECSELARTALVNPAHIQPLRQRLTQYNAARQLLVDDLGGDMLGTMLHHTRYLALLVSLDRAVSERNKNKLHEKTDEREIA